MNTGLSTVEIGKIFGGIHFSAVSKAVVRVKEEMTSDRKLMKVIEELNCRVKGRRVTVGITLAVSAVSSFVPV